MSDAVIAGIARDLARALVARARTRLPEDQKAVLHLQTDLCMAVAEEMIASEKSDESSLILN